MSENIWQFQDAKNRFTRLVKEAMQNGPQIVTEHDENLVVVISFEEYEQMTKPQTDLVTFLRNSPLANLEL
jgi:antitoxin Phd